MAVVCVALSIILLFLPGPPRQRVAGVLRGNLIGPIAVMQQRAALARRAFATNDSVVRAVDSVVLRSQRLDAVTAENAQLRGLLRLGRALRWGFIPAEALSGRELGDDHTLFLSAGARAGVERLSAVVSPDGIVGTISHVDAGTSIAITWPHPEFRVSATSADGNAFGIVSAHQGPGAERYLLELHGVPFRAKLAVGTPIVTSGLGGVFPRGVLIGTVLDEQRATTGWSRSYILRPAVRPADVTQVMILLPERNSEGVESAWAPGVESLVRRVTTAGDSVEAQQRDSLAAAGRQRLVDSLTTAIGQRLRDSLARIVPAVTTADTVPPAPERPR